MRFAGKHQGNGKSAERLQEDYGRSQDQIKGMEQSAERLQEDYGRSQDQIKGMEQSAERLQEDYGQSQEQLKALRESLFSLAAGTDASLRNKTVAPDSATVEGTEDV